MEQFLQYTVSGLSTGGIYSLVALGLALIYRSTRILNFAHGDITTIGTLVAFTLIGMKVPFAVAAVSGSFVRRGSGHGVLFLCPCACPTP